MTLNKLIEKMKDFEFVMNDEYRSKSKSDKFEPQNDNIHSICDFCKHYREMVYTTKIIRGKETKIMNYPIPCDECAAANPELEED